VKRWLARVGCFATFGELRVLENKPRIVVNVPLKDRRDNAKIARRSNTEHTARRISIRSSDVHHERRDVINARIGKDWGGSE
jgi:hypothetical protein